MTFPPKAVDNLLAGCHRRCCVCHRQCGIKMEIDHIKPKAEGGKDNIENAIALCLECHAEVHMYNKKHPRGRKYHPDELKLHKEQWLQICKKFPYKLAEPSTQTDGGPLSGLLSELEFDHKLTGMDTWGLPFETFQFQRAVSDGILSLLDDSLKETIMQTYALLKIINYHQEITSRLHPSDSEAADRSSSRTRLMKDVPQSIQETIQKLNDFLAQK